MVAKAYISRQAALAKVVSIAAGRAVPVLSACLAQLETNTIFIGSILLRKLQVLFDCPTCSPQSQQHSHLLYQASFAKAAFLTTVSGRELRSSFVQRRSVLASPH